MKPCLSLLLLLFLLHQSFTHAKTLEEICKYSQVEGVEYTYDFCVTTLQVDPRSRTAANLQELAIISSELTLHNASITYNKIGNLLENTTDPIMTTYLDSCLHLQKATLIDLEKANELVKEKEFFPAIEKFEDAFSKNMECRGAGEKLGTKDPLAKETDDLNQLINLTEDLTSP